MSPSDPQTPTRQRQVAWFQSSVVRRSSSAVDEAVDELTEKSQFLLRKSPRGGSSTCSTGSVAATTPRTSSSTGASASVSTGTEDVQERLDSTEEEGDNEEETVTTPIATFHRDEIIVGELLGEGTFSCVYEVTGFDLRNNDDTGCDTDEHDSNQQQQSLLRQQLASNSPTLYALKHLKDTLLQNSHEFEQAATDLVMEAKYLSALDHPNILKLHGEPLNGTAAINNGVDGYFLLCDRLSETLAGRIQRWRDGDLEAAESNTIDRKLSYALQIAQALNYLHEQRILFRDLKPSNIGFHQQDQERIQLFDFGLCRELPPQEQARPYVYETVQANANTMDTSTSSRLEHSVTMDVDESAAEVQQREEVYVMSGAGTQIYMAPEVLVQHRYNLKADVYSWAMTVTEMLLLEKPLPHYEMDEHIQYVCVEGDRPALEGHPEISNSVADLLAWAWEGNVSKRCSMAQVCEELQEIVIVTAEQQQGQSTWCCRPSWHSRIFQAASRLQQYLVSVMGRALDRVSSFLFRRNSKSSRDVTFDLPQEKEQAEEESGTKAPSSYNPRADADSPSPNNDGDGCALSPRPTPRVFRTAILKRKPSSASTTAMTDDELDDDDLGLPLFPFYSKPPMEALVERHNSSSSGAAP